MTVQEYRDRLFMALSAFERSEVESVVDYYTELIEDADDPEQQMAALGTPEQLATKVIRENGWVQPEEQFSGSRAQDGFAPPPPQPAGWSSGRLIALIFTLPFWIAGFAVIISLFFVIVGIYLGISVASVTSFIGAVGYINSFMPFAAELACVGLLLAGLAILLFRPAKALFRGVAGLVADYSYFLFVPGKYRQKKHFERKPINKIAVLSGAVMLTAGIAGTFICENRISRSAEAYIQQMGLESFETKLNSTEDISMSATLGDVTVLPSSDGSSKLVCENVKQDRLKIVKGDKLKISYTPPQMEKRLPTLHINIGSMNTFQKTIQPRFTLYVPDEKLKKLKLMADLGNVSITGISSDELVIDCSCGDLKIESGNALSFSLNNDLGSTEISDFTMGAADIEANCGKVKLSAVNCSGRLTIEDNLGDIEAADCAFGSVNVNDDCGDIEFKNTSIISDSEITNSLGDVSLDLKGSDYGVKASADTGDVTINGRETNETEGSIKLRIDVSTGSVDVEYS